MSNFTRTQILDEAKTLASALSQTEHIEHFKKVEAKINANHKVQALIARIKTLQKEAVNLQAYEKMKALENVEDEIDRLQVELDTIPIVEEFKDTQGTVNEILQDISGTIADQVTNALEETTGKDA